MSKQIQRNKALYVENKLHKRLKLASIKLNAPMTELVDNAINNYLDNLKPRQQVTQQAIS